MLHIAHLSKTFSSSGRPKIVLNDITFYADGGVLRLLGPNGSGKTTLLKILCGLILPDRGTIRAAGFDLPAQTDAARRVTGFSPAEERSFYGRLTGLENLRFFARLRNLDEKIFQERLNHLEEPLRLKELLALPYQEISAGMKQRLSLARALLHSPRLLLLDEPTKSLDPAGAARFEEFIVREFQGRQGRLALWSACDPAQARALGPRVETLP